MKLLISKTKNIFRLHTSQQSAMRKVLLILALLALVMVTALLLPKTERIEGYLSLHILLESVSILISMMVFAVGWNAYSNKLPGNIVMLAAVFMGVGLLDFSHILSFVGMPDFVTPSGVDKSIYFWLAARSLATVALLVFVLVPWRPFPSASTRYLLMALVLALVAAFNWLFLFHPAILPEMFHPKQGLSLYKIYTEYTLIAVNILTALLLLPRMHRPQPFLVAALFGALCTMAMSEFLFTIFTDVTDIYNLLGHIYKVIAYLFIYRVIFVTTIQNPYRELRTSQNRLQATIAALPDLLFEVGLDGRYYDFHSQNRNVSSSQDDRVIGKTMLEILPPDVAEIGLSALKEAHETGFSKGEYELELLSGRHWFEFSVSPKAVEKGEAPRFIVLSRNVTGRKMAELKQHESNQILENVIDNIPHMIFLKRAADLHYMLLNLAGEKMLGVNREQVVGHSDYELFPKEQAQLLTAKDREVLQQHTIVDIQEEFVKTPYGNRFFHTKKMTLRDENGQPQYLLGISEDITERKQSQAALLESEQFLRETQSIANLGSYILDIRTGRWKSSDILNRIFGIDETYDRSIEGWNALVHPDDSVMIGKYLFDEVIGKGEPFNKEYRIIRKSDQTLRWVHGLGELTFDAAGIPVEMKGTILDITARKEAQETLVKLSLAVEQSPNSIVITDVDANIEYVNAAFTKITGYTPEEVLGKNPNIMHSGKVSEATYEEMWAELTAGKTWHGELINRRKDQSEYIESAVISPVRQADGRITNYLAIKEDITEKRKVEKRIENLAHFDQLTGLPNRALLNDRITYLLNMAKRNNKSFAVMFLDLDHFKNINDTLGHSIGDELLREMAERLKRAIRVEDTVSRLGGDEFIIIIPNADANSAIHVATKLIAAVSKPCNIYHHELTVTPSIGIAIYPNDGDDFETLSKNADTAMYRVKQENRNNFRFFTQEMQVDSTRNLLLGNALRSALIRTELELHYQPQVAMEDGRIIGAEALLRWKHPEFDMISPAEFIPIAEDNGQIIPIGEWVLRTAVNQMKEWMDSGLPPMIIAVNLSAIQFRQPGLTDLVTRILDEIKLPPEQLELELTEAAAMDDPNTAIAIMDRLHEQGVRMAIDDFGTGYSSLSHLKRFKVYKLKIDQSFVQDIIHDADDKAIVSTIINMASELGLRTIAEGVETAEQLAFLRLKGCEEVQGYYFSKPLPAEQFAAYVKESIRLVL
ncbi:MAG: EAL domain-containing protein [Helicobacteraceae bacterium]|jgi:diguanylate cyclase (GGDEF)-like protein/PAS domain S-box-containing protein|nr:EAL domain-containing protein [Helicobacteraceae bacterium]